MRDNEHVTLHHMRGFLADDLLGAFQETEAVSFGTKCRQYLFSLSLNPPPDAEVPMEDFEAAIAAVEKRLGLSGQPRAIVFHEKKGRRHAHCVWSRIDARQMPAINLPHFKMRLQDISRELYRRHAWKMPPGLIDGERVDPLNFTQIEAAQAQKSAHDPKDLKAFIIACWERSESAQTFKAAIAERGLALAPCNELRMRTWWSQSMVILRGPFPYRQDLLQRWTTATRSAFTGRKAAP